MEGNPNSINHEGGANLYGGSISKTKVTQNPIAGHGMRP